MVINIVNYNRTETAKKSIDSLKAAINKPYLKVHLIDDCSENDEIVKYAAKKLSFPIFQFHITQNYSNLGVEQNNITRLNHNLYKSGQFVYLTDNDVEYSSAFLAKLLEAEKLMEYDTTILALTLFNYKEGSHFELPIPMSSASEYINENYTYKNTFGGISVLIRVEDFKRAMEFYKSSQYTSHQGWDWGLCEYARIMGRTLVATKSSYVNHIGAEGINTVNGKYDTVDNFID